MSESPQSPETQGPPLPEPEPGPVPPAGGTPPKSKVVAGLLGIFLGGLGIHRFYLGYTTIGILQIVANIACGAGAVWGLIEGILILCGSTITTDAEGHPLVD